jgi:cellulose 1,4-beta-cellobiosidase
MKMSRATALAVCTLISIGCAEAEEFDPRDLIHSDASGPGTPTAGTGVAGASSVTSSSSATSTGSPATTGAGGASSTGSGGAATSTGSGGAGAGTGGASTTGPSTTGSSGAGPSTGGSGGAPPSDGGTGGTADAGVDRAPPPPTNGFQVLYKCVGTNTMANAIQAETTIEDTGPATVPLNELTLRYYFSNEIVGTPVIDIGFSGLNPGFHDLKSLETTQVAKVQNPTFTADSYIEFGFMSGAGLIAPSQSVIIAWQYHGQNFPSLNQTNDYSFDPSKTSATPWERVVLMRGNFVIWGTPP